MLSYLSVNNLASIKNVEIGFDAGFNVLTGETGAGKTVLIQAIGLLLGDRAESVRIRQGASSAELECTFDLNDRPEVKEKLIESGIISTDDDELMLGRSISAGGKSKCRVNGRLCPVSMLSEIGDITLDVHGQNTHQALVNVNTHREYIDRYAGRKHLENLGNYRMHYRLLVDLKKERENLGEPGNSERKAGLLSHEINQIDEASLEIGELEALEDEASRMRHSKELAELGNDVRSMLYTGESRPCAVSDTIAEALAEIRRMREIDNSLSVVTERLESLSFELDDIGSELMSYLDDCDFDSGRQQEVESRINLIRDLLRKFGGSVEEVVEHREKAARELEEIERSRERYFEIDRELKDEIRILIELAGSLSEGRKKAAGKLEREVNRQLGELEMGGSGIKVKIDSALLSGDNGVDIPPDFGPFGTDRVEFVYAPRKGMSYLPLRKIASGGEISRAMLAIKIVLAGADRVPVLIFDEIDAGIGGETAARVGEKLYALTKHHQVFCITHQPQIATFADHQYRVEKEDGGEASGTAIELLSGEGRVDEMCRMLGDSSGRNVTKEHASDILIRSEEKKHEIVVGKE